MRVQELVACVDRVWKLSLLRRALEGSVRPRVHLLRVPVEAQEIEDGR